MIEVAMPGPTPAESAEEPLAAHTANYRAMAAPAEDFRNANLARLLVGYARGRSFLDLGCGYGSILATARLAGLDVCGVEPDAELIALSNDLFGDLGIVSGTVESFRSERRFDNVVLADVLEAVEDDESVLRAAATRLAPGGRLILSLPAMSALHGSRDEMMGYHRRYDREPTLALVRGAGLEVVECRHWNALFVAPYFVAYRLLRLRTEYDGLRGGNARGRLRRLAASGFDAWFRHVERRVDLGFGLSLIVVARKA